MPPNASWIWIVVGALAALALILLIFTGSASLR